MEKAENNIGPYEYLYNIESLNNKLVISKHYPKMPTSSLLVKILKIIFTVVIFVPLVISLIWHILVEHQSSFLSLENLENSIFLSYYITTIIILINFMRMKTSNFFNNLLNYVKEYKEIYFNSTFVIKRKFTTIRIKLLLLWFILLVSFTYELVINVLNYDKNERDGKKYKLSKFYGKETYIVDSMIMLYSRLIIAVMVSIYICIYEVVSFESETFEKECKYFIEEDFSNFSNNIDIISKKHVRLFKLITLSHTTAGTYTDPIVMQCVVTIIMAVPIIRYYFSTISDIIQAINYIIVLISFALIMVLHLSSISNTVKSLRNIKNIILNSPKIWDNGNSKVRETALSIISRTEHCDYHGKIIQLIPLDDKTIPILLIIIHIVAFLAGVATV
uniref:Gustatory receptor n=1 Tax=Strongyloides papillosus TaxID=174720 RepID=A0A0N5CHU0_STREA